MFQRNVASESMPQDKRDTACPWCVRQTWKPWNGSIVGADPSGNQLVLHQFVGFAATPHLTPGLTYVVQRLAAVYGMRQDILEDVLIPGVFDALGVAAGTALLRAELPQLEAEAKRMRQNLGVDVQQPLVQLIRRLA